MTVPAELVGVLVVGETVGPDGAIDGEKVASWNAWQDSRIGSMAVCALSSAVLAASVLESAVASFASAAITSS